MRRSTFGYAVLALVFLAISAYGALWLYERVEQKTAVLERRSITVSAPMRGIALRRERCVETDAAKQSPRRYSAAELNGTSAVYCLGCDGLEALGPELLTPLSVERVEALLQQKSKAAPLQARLVEDFVWNFAAVLDALDAPPRGEICRISFSDGVVTRARVVDVAVEGERAAVLFRLTEGDSGYCRRFEDAELLGETYTGLQCPLEALHSDGDGKDYVIQLSGERRVRTEVEIPYRSGTQLLITARDLYPGSMVLLGEAEERK